MKTREQLRAEMKGLAIRELSSQADNFKQIGVLLDEYIREYKADKWIDDFRYSYLSERHQGFYEEQKAKQEARNKAKKNYKWLVGDDK